MFRRRLFLWLLAAASVMLALLILTDGLPLLRGPAPDSAEWHWPYALRPLHRWWAPLASALLLWLLAAWWLRDVETVYRQRPGCRSFCFLAGLALATILIQVGIIYAGRPDVAAELIDRTLAVPTSGYFWTAAQIGDLDAQLRRYPAGMAAFESEHARTHPPGLVIANWLTLALFRRTPSLAQSLAPLVWQQRCTDLWLLNSPAHVAAALGVWAWLPILLAGAVVFPAYALARKLAPAGAKLAAALVATLPALLVFAPLPDPLYALLTLLIFLALHQALQQQRLAWFFLAGLLLSLGSFLSLGNVALALALLPYAGLRIWQKPGLRRQWGTWLRWLLAFVLGLSSLWLVYWIGWGVPPWAIIRAGLAAHYELVTSQRPYNTWLIFNLVDLLVFAGVPVLLGFMSAVVAAGRGPRQSGPIGALALSAALLLVTLNLSGSTRGEVGRIWLFALPLLALPAASRLAQKWPHWRSHFLIVGLQLLLVLAVGLAWRPVAAVITIPEPPPMPAASAESLLDVAFHDEPITLHGYTLNSSQAIPGGFLDLTLLWQAAGPARRPYTVFNHLVNENGQLAAQQDNWPAGGQWPPTCWREGESVVDPYQINLPADLDPGVYTLLTGLYDATTGQRLPTTNGQDAITLTNIIIPAHP